MSSPSDIRKVDYPKKRHLSEMLRLTGTRDRLIGCIEKESILGKDISTCLPVSLNVSNSCLLAVVSLEH